MAGDRSSGATATTRVAGLGWSTDDGADNRDFATRPPGLPAPQRGASYAQCIKPFNFVLTAAGAKSPASVPMGNPFRLVAPYETDPRRWVSLGWVDVHIPGLACTHHDRDGRPGMARVDTFGDVLAKYETHPDRSQWGRMAGRAGRERSGCSGAGRSLLGRSP